MYSTSSKYNYSKWKIGKYWQQVLAASTDKKDWPTGRAVGRTVSKGFDKKFTIKN
jgi:hypothetical protein